MRALATCLAVLATWHGGVHADPAAPLSPDQSRREDAQRLREQLRDLEREHPAVIAPPAPPGPASTWSSSRTAGLVLLGVAGACAATTVALYLAAPDDSYDTAKTIGITTTAITGVVGLSVVISSRRVRVAPAVGPRTAGLAIAGPL